MKHTHSIDYALQTSTSGNGSDGQSGLAKTLHSTEAIQAWLITRVAKALQLQPEEIDIKEPFARYGLDSLAAVSLSGELEDWLGREFPATLAWDYPNIESLAKYLSDELTKTVSGSSGQVD